MCGYCTEQMAINALQASSTSDAETFSHELFLAMYLQEVLDFSGALRQLATHAAVNQLDASASMHRTAANTWVASVIMCRAIEILVVHGFESAVYQELLQQPPFISAISVACAKGAEAMRSDLDSHFNASDFAWLVEKDTYLVPGCFKQHNNEASDQANTSLLYGYIDWWLDGGSVPHQDADQIFKDTGIQDSINDIPETERLPLSVRFPALWFALLRTTYLPAGAKILWAIITRNPSGMPDFEGLDLWLQRRAALAYYDQHGIGPFLSEINSVRTELLQYLAASRITKAEEKNTLIAALVKHGYEMAYPGPDEWQWADPSLNERRSDNFDSDNRPKGEATEMISLRF